MAIVTGEPVRRNIPHEKGQWVEFRRLSAAQFRRARERKAEEQQQQSGAMLRALGPELVEAFADRDREKQDTIVAEMRRFEYDVSNFDQPLLLRFGIVAWSYDGVLPSEHEDPTEVLDPVTADWCAEQVIAISRPETEDEEGNVSEPSPSTASEKATTQPTLT